ncbi:MAG: non-canonical purine NTP pyrophosphatase [Phycisphaeraceae bacterium]|nr:non-canonical purine NTP pyrophosphatase [Phycisphaeraceae bacterium]
MTILLATSNPHKLAEIAAVLGDGAGLLSLGDMGRAIAEPVEDQPTFAGNALLKARYYARAFGLLCLADDSGLEVDALGGEPGVLSARYSGRTGPRGVVDPANNRLLLEKLADVPIARRGARFVCAMTLCSPEQSEPLAEVRGVIEGRILTAPEAADPSQPERGRGDNGFGYDPIFFVPALGKTTAELAPADKNAISHRGQATRLMAAHLRRLGLLCRSG